MPWEMSWIASRFEKVVFPEEEGPEIRMMRTGSSRPPGHDA